MKASFIYSPKFGQAQVRPDFAWRPERSDVTYNLCLKHGLFSPANITLDEPVPAPREEVLTFHEKEYLDLLVSANDGHFEEYMLANGLGITECPVFKGVWDYTSLTVGASLLGADLILNRGYDVVFSPTGGMHHAGPDFAAGFCYLNDAVIAIQRLRAKGMRVLYVDIDVHHGDLVQETFYEDDQVFCLSFHESPETLFPFKVGFEHETGQGRGKGFNINVPFMAGTGDEVYEWAFDQIFPEVVERFKPDVIVGVFGVDTIYSDPMAHLLLTNNATTRNMARIAQAAPRLLAFGCGGYVLDNIARAWTLGWAAITGQELMEDSALTLGGVFLGEHDVSLSDGPHFVAQKTLAETRVEARRVVEYIKKVVLT